jgi:hypothetical protein
MAVWAATLAAGNDVSGGRWKGAGACAVVLAAAAKCLAMYSLGKPSRDLGFTSMWPADELMLEVKSVCLSV